MPGQTRPTTVIFIMTATTIVIAAFLGAVAGIYLGRRYQPRSPRAQIARRPPVSSPTAQWSAPLVKGAPPPPSGAAKREPAQGAGVPAVKAKPSVPGTRPLVPHAELTSPTKPVRRHPAPGSHSVRQMAVLPRHPPLAGQARPRPEVIQGRARRNGLPVVRTPPVHGPRASSSGQSVRIARRVVRPRPARLASAAGTIPLHPVGLMPPVRRLPVPRRVRQQRLAHALAASRRRWARVAERPSRRPGRRLGRHRSRPARGERPRALVIASAPPLPAAARAVGLQPLSPAERARALRRAEQTVRYVEQPVSLDGRPATLATYTVWEQGKPRTFSFVRQDQRTDLAKIVRVDEATRQVSVFVPDRGALIQAVVPITAMVAYSRALQLNPPPADLLARADALLGAGGQPPAIAAAPPTPAAGPPVERVAGMREQTPELVGRVDRVDPRSRLIVLAGPRDRTPFRVAEGIDLPTVGQIVSLTTTEARVSPRPATSITVLQPTVAGVVTLVRPTAVELTVRTISPDGQVEEVPVPVSGDARVFISGAPGDLRALRKGIYIRAYMTPAGEARILGPPSE